MSHQRFGSQRAKLILSGVGAVSLIAVLCAQWLFAELRRPRPERASGEPLGVATLPPTPAPVTPVAPVPATQASAPPRAPDETIRRPSAPAPARTGQAGSPIQDRGAPAGLSLAPTVAEKPNVDQTAGIRTEPRPVEPGAEPDARRAEPKPSHARDTRERRLPAPESRTGPTAAEGSRGAQVAPTPAPSTRADREPQDGSSTPLATATAPANGSAGQAERGDLQAVVDQITRLRDDVRGVGDRITTLRKDVRADISRLEAKMQALEPRQAGGAPNRPERDFSRAPGGSGTVGSQARNTPPPAGGRPSTPEAPSPRMPADARPQAPEALAAEGSKSAPRALRRPPARERRLTESSAAPKPSTAPRSTAVLPSASGKPEPGASPRNEASATPPSSKRTTIRRPAGGGRLARKGPVVVRSAGAGPFGRRPMDLSTAPRRLSDQRYASFRSVAESAGMRDRFRNARRSLRYRPILECVP